jgi:ADYC domain
VKLSICVVSGFALGVSPGCALDESMDPSTETVALQNECPTWGCTSNSSVVAGIEFHELKADGTEFNDEGLRLVTMLQGGVEYTLDIDGDRLRGLDDTGAVALEDGDLLGAFLQLEIEDTEPTDYVYIEITAVTDELTFWVGDTDETIQTYQLEWRSELNTPTRGPVCPLLVDTLIWGNAADHEVIMFEGDRYNGHTKEVTAIGNAADDWFNIACAGGAKAKLHTNRHTTPGSAPGFRTSRNRRQTLLKAYTADYCGTGQSFTEVGEPLLWQNQPSWNLIGLAGSTSDEAVWNQTGAICLQQPRMGETWWGALETYLYVLDQCDELMPPLCTDQLWFPGGWRGPGYIRTANP